MASGSQFNQLGLREVYVVTSVFNKINFYYLLNSETVCQVNNIIKLLLLI